MFKSRLITRRDEYEELIKKHVVRDQEFNLYTNGMDELRSLIDEVRPCCGQTTFVKEHFEEVVYEIPWCHFDLVLLKTGIGLTPKANIVPMRRLLYKGNPVWKIEICAPRHC